MKVDDLNSHAYALWAVGLILQKQGQPIEIKDCDKKGFTLGMRVNLNKIQAERLIVKPIDNEVVGYKSIPDFENKIMKVVRIAVPRRKTAPTAGGGETQD